MPFMSGLTQLKVHQLELNGTDKEEDRKGKLSRKGQLRLEVRNSGGSNIVGRLWLFFALSPQDRHVIE